MNNTVPLKKNYEFGRAYKKGRFFAGRLIVLYVVPNRLDHNRLGITAGKKIGKSVRRNRIKRLVRESYRLLEGTVKEGYDLVFVVRYNEIVPSFWDIKREMKFLFKKLEILDQEKLDCLKEL